MTAKAQNSSTASPETCKVYGCKRLVHQKKWCSMHYFRWYRGRRLGGNEKLQRHRSLTDEQVNELRALARQTVNRGYTLHGFFAWAARKHNCDPSHLHKAVVGKTYKSASVPPLEKHER